MSVYTTTFVMFGVLLPYPEHVSEDRMEQLHDAHGVGYYDSDTRPGPSFIADSMDGEWCAVGKVYARSRADCDATLPCNFTIPATVDKAAKDEIVALVREYGLNRNKMGYRLGWHVVVYYS